MALKAGSVQALPDLACVGLVKKVGEAYLSEKGVYHVIPIEIEGKYAGRNGVFFLVFEPRWFSDGFDPEELVSERDAKGRPIKHGMYRRTVADTAKPSVLQAMLGEDFDAFAANFDSKYEETEGAKAIGSIIRESLVGRDVLYVMKQRKEEDGTLTEQYNIQSFYTLNDDNLAYLAEQQNNERRKTPLQVTWDEE
jgi:hypothetical protein